MGWVGNATPRPLYPLERPGTHCVGGWVDPRADLDGCGKSSTGIRSLYLPARSQLQYRLSYRGQRTVQEILLFLHTGQTVCGAQPACYARCTGSVSSMGQIGLQSLRLRGRTPSLLRSPLWLDVS